jgi:hypothetical protein
MRDGYIHFGQVMFIFETQVDGYLAALLGEAWLKEQMGYT